MPCNPQILKSSNPQILKSSKNSVKTFTRLSSAICLALSVNAYAVNQVYTASATGSDGSSGTVSFTIDNGIAGTGGSIIDTSCGSSVTLKAFSLTMTGGSVPSGSQTWTCAQVTDFICQGSAGATLPCGADLNFGANNSTVNFGPAGPKAASESWAAGKQITWGTVSLGSNPTNAPIDLNMNKPVETFATEIELK